MLFLWLFVTDMFPFFLLLPGSLEASFLPSFGNLLDCFLPLLLDVCDHSALYSVLIQSPGFSYCTYTHLSLTPTTIFSLRFRPIYVVTYWNFYLDIPLTCQTQARNWTNLIPSTFSLHSSVKGILYPILFLSLSTHVQLVSKSFQFSPPLSLAPSPFFPPSPRLLS